MKKERRKYPLPPLSFRARIFAALVGISATTSLVIGLVLYYFAEDRLVAEERDSLARRSQTANAGAGVFLEGLRDPEEGTFPAPETYAEELVQSVADPTGLGVLYAGPDGEPMAARDGAGQVIPAEEAYERLGIDENKLEEVEESSQGEGQLVSLSSPRSGVAFGGAPRNAAVWPLMGADGAARGVLVYDSPEEGLDRTLTFLRYGILGAIGTSIVLAGLGSMILARQISRPLTETRDAAIRVASGDYSSVPVKSNDELGELARAFNYMAEELQHYVGEIQRQKSRLEAVLDASPEAVVATDAEERVTMANPAAARMLGIESASFGHKLPELKVPREVITCLREASSTGAAVREMEVGEKTYWAYAARMPPPKDDDRRANDSAKGSDSDHGVIVAVRDITEYRSLERAKTAFVSDVSHELRTPLTTIQSAVDLIERARERLDPLELRALELADQELKRIRGMVEELLTLTLMDSRQSALEVAPTDLDAVIRSALQSMETKAKRFGIELHYAGDETRGGLEDNQPRCLCDAQKIYQVLLNLLDNAVKYSDPGARVKVCVLDDYDSVTVRIEDTGVGIPEEDLPNLFDRFYRVNKDRSRATGGSGLGLAISKQIVDLHGGALSVKSKVDVGSTFDLKLPKASLPRPASSYAL
ncbi:MAG: ATP-binding protein [Rubrobacteraceae bacterium]